MYYAHAQELNYARTSKNFKKRQGINNVLYLYAKKSLVQKLFLKPKYFNEILIVLGKHIPDR